ncbi:MAG TPA: hypothetical protein VF989_19190, partial [Polyangiaceae bacterium]
GGSGGAAMCGPIDHSCSICLSETCCAALAACRGDEECSEWAACYEQGRDAQFGDDVENYCATTLEIVELLPVMVNVMTCGDACAACSGTTGEGG